MRLDKTALKIMPHLCKHEDLAADFYLFYIR